MLNTYIILTKHFKENCTSLFFIVKSKKILTPDIFDVHFEHPV